MPELPVPAPSHQSEVEPLLSRLSTSNMQYYLSYLTAFNNRYYKAQSGADASAWILSEIKSVGKIQLRFETNNSQCRSLAADQTSLLARLFTIGYSPRLS